MFKVWHNAEERPEDGRIIIGSNGCAGQYEYESGRETVFCEAGHIEFLHHWQEWNIRWAYIEDALAAIANAEHLAAIVRATQDYIKTQVGDEPLRRLGQYIDEALEGLNLNVGNN